MTNQFYDRAEVIRSLNLFVGKGGIAEIRILNAFGSKGRNDSGYFDNFAQAAGALQQYANSPKNPGIYFVLNPFSPELMARASNRFEERARETTQDADIIRRKWLFIDCDPKRKTGISSTNEEWEAARARATQVAEWLKSEFDFPAPIMASSGNGFHLDYRIDMEADEESKLIIKNCLRAIAAKFDDDAVTIDTKVFNAARICKLYGTMARKGDSTADRPHRLSKIIEAPEVLAEVPVFTLLSLAALAPAEKVREPIQVEKKSRKPGKSPVDRARAYLAKVPGAIAGSSGHDWTYHAACLLMIDFGLPLEDAMPLMQEWNETCQPPWTESELLHKLESADAAPGERGAALKTNRQKWEDEQTALIERKRAIISEGNNGETNGHVVLDPLAYHKKVLDDIGIVYCCETESTEIEVFSRDYRKFSVIRDAGKLSFPRLLQIAGLAVESRVAMNPSDAEGKPYSMNTVRNALAAVAGSGKRGNEKLGQGIWRLSDKIVLVNGGHLAVYRDGKITREDSAVFEDNVFELGAGEEWFDFDSVSGWIGKPNRDWIYDVLIQLCSVLEQWRFRIPDPSESPSICVEILASLIVASWIQSFWTFRPMTFLLGESNCGKSTLFEFMLGEESDPLNNGLIGNLAIHSSNQSVAGIRQSAERASRPVFIDEFEKSKNRAEILELLRGSSRGSQTIRGTASQKAVSTKLAFMAWAASTESGLLKQVDQNRWISIQMVTPENDKMGNLKLPSIEETTALRNKLVAAAVVIGCEARALVDALMTRRPKKVDHRICQIFAVPAAVFSTMAGLPLDSAADAFSRMTKVFDSGTLEKDQEAALDVILTSKIGKGHAERSVLSLINDEVSSEFAQGEIERNETLAINGLRIVDEEQNGIKRKFLFLNPKVVSRELLFSSSLAGVKIDDLLLRLSGAKRANRRISGKSMRGILIPMELVLPPESELFAETVS